MTTLKFRNDDKVNAKVFILDSIENIDKIGLREDEANHVRKSYDDDKGKTVVINRYTECYHIFFIDSEEPENKFMEQCRRKGASICKWLVLKDLLQCPASYCRINCAMSWVIRI